MHHMIEISQVHQASPKPLWIYHGSQSLRNCHGGSRLEPKLRHDALQVFGYPQTEKKHVDPERKREKITFACLVPIPVFQHFVFTGSPEIVRVFLEGNLHHTFLMCENRFVTISKIKPPYFDIFVRRTGDNQFRIMRDVHGKDRKL